MTGPGLKSRHVTGIAALLAIDIAICVFIAWPANDANQAALTSLARFLAAVLAPPVLYLLSSILSDEIKASLVFWRAKAALPSYRAFSVYVNSDHRIDVKKLLRKVKKFPESPKQQSSMWYGLYDEIRDRSEVVDANKRFLFFRDVAAVSALLSILLPTMAMLQGERTAALAAFFVFFIQYLLAALASRLAGSKLVRTVLAVTSHRP